MRAKTFLEIHHALLNGDPLEQCYHNGTEYIGLYNGLCCVWLNDQPLSDNNIFNLFEPVDYTDCDSVAYFCDSNHEKGRVYNDLRQNIILLCAAINGEL